MNTFSNTARICVFQLARRLWSCSCEKSASQLSSHCCQVARTSANTARACCTRSPNNSGEGTSLASSIAPNGKLPSANNASNASHKLSLLRKESSMFKRSIPSVYSPMRGKGMTTSSLILKALVWRLMAAVRLRSSQNFLRASGLIAMKPSPLRELARRTTSEVARATSSALSPAISPTNTILGRPPRLLLVA